MKNNKVHNKRNKRKTRKNYNQWVHYKISSYECFGFTAICGRQSPQCEHERTTILNNVTCPRCIEELKKQHWYCANDGFIDPVSVTNDETCELCGEDV